MSFLRRTVLGLAGGLSLFALGSCSERSPTGLGVSTIHVQDDDYSPPAATVTTGTTVHFIWEGSNQHTVSFNDGPTSIVQTTGTFDRLFTVAGVYPYLCAVHGASMSGTITVQ